MEFIISNLALEFTIPNLDLKFIIPNLTLEFIILDLDPIDDLKNDKTEIKNNKI